MACEGLCSAGKNVKDRLHFYRDIDQKHPEGKLKKTKKEREGVTYPSRSFFVYYYPSIIGPMKEYAIMNIQAKATLIQQACRASFVFVHCAVPSCPAKFVVG